MPGCLCENCKRPAPPLPTTPARPLTADDRQRDAEIDWRDRYREDPED